MRRSLTIAGLVLASLAVAACGPSKSASSSSASGSGSGNANTMACLHWSNIKGDLRAGILTDSELRTKVSEVRESASVPAVEAAATSLLAGLTSGSKAKLEAGTAALESACE